MPSPESISAIRVPGRAGTRRRGYPAATVESAPGDGAQTIAALPTSGCARKNSTIGPTCSVERRAPHPDLGEQGRRRLGVVERRVGQVLQGARGDLEQPPDPRDVVDPEGGEPGRRRHGPQPPPGLLGERRAHLHHGRRVGLGERDGPAAGRVVPGERRDPVDDEVRGHQVERHPVGAGRQRHQRRAALAQDQLQHVVGAVELLGPAGDRVAHDHRRPVDRHRQARVARLRDDPLGLVLGVVVVVRERLAELQVLLEEDPVVAARDVAGADVLQSAQPRPVGGGPGEGHDVAGAVDVDPPGDRRGHREVVHRREVEDLQLGVEQPRADAVVEPEARRRDVPDDEVGAARRSPGRRARSPRAPRGPSRASAAARGRPRGRPGSRRRVRGSRAEPRKPGNPVNSTALTSVLPSVGGRRRRAGGP